MPGKRPSVTQLWFLWHFAEMQLLLRDSFVLCFLSLQLSLCRRTGESPALTAALGGEVRDTVMAGQEHSLLGSSAIDFSTLRSRRLSCKSTL